MINKLPFVLWFNFGYIVFLMISMLIAVYGYGARVGMEMQLYSAVFAVKMFSTIIMISAVIPSAGFFVGVILSGCKRRMWLAIVLGISYGVLALFAYIYSHNINTFFGSYTSIFICVLGFLGGLMLPIFVHMVQLTKNTIEE